MGTQIYFEDGEIVANHGQATAYHMDDCLILEIGPGHNLWALENEVSTYLNQLKDYPKGDCLEVGLGLGIASRCILSYALVEHLTTVEINKDVIGLHEKLIPILDGSKYSNKWLPYNSNRHTIVNENGLTYLCTTKEKYDFIFLDFWQQIDDQTLPYIADMVYYAKKTLTDDGILMGWLDPYTESTYRKEFINLFKGGCYYGKN